MRTYGRNFLGKVDRLGNITLSRLERTLQVDVANLLAKIGGGGQQPDETVFNTQFDVGSGFDFLLKVTLGLDEKLLAAIVKDVSTFCSAFRVLSKGGRTPWEGWGPITSGVGSHDALSHSTTATTRMRRLNHFRSSATLHCFQVTTSSPLKVLDSPTHKLYTSTLDAR